MVFFLKKRDEKSDHLHLVLQNSFKGVKHDIFKIFEWLNYFYHQNIQQEKVIYDLKKQLNNMPKTREEIRDLIDEYYSLEPLQNEVERITSKLDSLEESRREIMSLAYKIEEIKSKVDSLGSGENTIHLTSKIDDIKAKIEFLEQQNKPVTQQIQDFNSRLETLEKLPQITQKPVITLRENLIRKIAKSSKDHVKTILKSLIIKYGQVSALQLREIVVEEQGLCSKSSFYRILEEIEQEDDVTVIHEKKEKKYIYNAIKIK